MTGRSVVYDLGSASLKAGFGGEEQPKTFRVVVGRPKHKQCIAAEQSDSVFVSNSVDARRGLLKLSFPVTHGHITDMDDLKSVLTFANATIGVAAKEHGALISEAAFTSRPQRNRLSQAMFEDFQHPGVVFASQGVLAMYAAGTTTGIVLDVGEGVMQTAPVVDGYSIVDSVRRVDFGGVDVTAYLRNLLREHGTFLDSSAEVEIVKQIKEQKCQVNVATHMDAVKTSRFKLPDGSDVALGPEVLQANEALFNPALLGKEHSGVVGITSESIKFTDINLRRELYRNILLAGGSTLPQGFCVRFLNEMTKLTPLDCKVRVLAPAERIHSTWVGGSFLSELSLFKHLTVTRSEYQEDPDLVHARVFC